MSAQPFWKQKTLEQMSKQEWESLCDGCGKCCLQKLQDEDTDVVYYTNLVCQYMSDDCACTVYQTRNEKVPNCVWLKPEDMEHFFWLPSTCAYRLIWEGKDLFPWHPLISGDKNSVKESGVAIINHPLVKDNKVAEQDWEDHLINWVD